MDIKNKTAIGRATCLRLAELGAKVVVADLNLAGAEATAQLCGGNAHQWDTSSPKACAALIHSLERVDILHNNAGLLSNLAGLMVRTPMAANSPKTQALPPEQRQKVDEMLVEPAEVVDSCIGEARFVGKSGLPPEGKMIKGL